MFVNALTITVRIFVILAVFSACKKQKLQGDALLFKGSWQQIQQDEEQPITLEFREKGSYRIHKNGRLLEGGKIAYSRYTASNDWDFNLTFQINSLVNPDKLMQKTMLGGNCVLKLRHPDTLLLALYHQQSFEKTYVFFRK